MNSDNSNIPVSGGRRIVNVSGHGGILNSSIN